MCCMVSAENLIDFDEVYKPIQTGKPELTVLIPVCDLVVADRTKWQDEHLEFLKRHILWQKITPLGDDEVRFVLYKETVASEKPKRSSIFVVSRTNICCLSNRRWKIYPPDCTI